MPKRNDPEAQLNAALNAIDAALPRIHKRVRDAQAPEPLPEPTIAPRPRRRRATGVLGRKKSAAQIRRTRMQFQAMSEDTLLTDSGDDITLTKVNGSHKPEPKD